MEKKRLQSLKLPRDLTLGGTKPKKTFTPNLNATRNKIKAKGLGIIKNEDKRKCFYTKKNSENHKNFVEKSERFVQSSGIFSEGMGTDVLRKARYDRTYSSRDEPNNVMAVPKVKKDAWQVDNKNETKVYDDIMGCESSMNDEEEISPFNPISWNENDFKETRVPISNKTEVKTEPKIDLDRIKIETNNIPKEFQDIDHFSDNNPSLALWNLPDSFAGKGLSDDPNVETVFDYKLTDMLEGQIGKMKIHQSGKIDVFIGCVRYEIQPTWLESFSEKIVSIDKNKDGGSSSAVVLGQIQNRYILNPDWTFLLCDS